MGLMTTIMPPPRKPSSKPPFHAGKIDRIISDNMPARPTLRSTPAAQTYRSDLSDAQKFGKRLYELRTERELTQMQLAVATELDRSYISDLERGMKAPTLTTMRVIADVFMISISELCSGI